MAHLLSSSEITLFLHHEILAGERCIIGGLRETLLSLLLIPPPSSLPYLASLLPSSAKTVSPAVAPLASSTLMRTFSSRPASANKNILSSPLSGGCCSCRSLNATHFHFTRRRRQGRLKLEVLGSVRGGGTPLEPLISISANNAGRSCHVSLILSSS